MASGERMFICALLRLHLMTKMFGRCSARIWLCWRPKRCREGPMVHHKKADTQVGRTDGVTDIDLLQSPVCKTQKVSKKI